jgi:Protein of unknown function (DUF1579)
MKGRSTLLGACLVVSLTGFPIAAMAQTAPPPPQKPGPEHQKLGYFVGKWVTEGEMKSSPMGPGGKLTSADTCEWFEGHYAVVCRGDGKGPAGAMKSVGILGYNAEEKVYTYYGIDNTAMNMATVAKGTVKGDTWTYTDEGTMGGQKFKTRVTIKELSPTSYTFKMELGGPDGKWAPMMEAKSTKK